MTDNTLRPLGNTVTLLGAGSWGTALAEHLARGGMQVTIWDRDTGVLAAINSEHKNPRYLKEALLNTNIIAEPDLSRAIGKNKLIVFAVPSSATREVAHKAAAHIDEEALSVNVAKGLEEGTSKRLSQVLAEELGEQAEIAVLSGPSFAKEVVEDLPTAVTIAAHKKEIAKKATVYFHHHNFRVYTSEDVIGVELGGALKNVIALAAGVVDGCGMGTNARAALITRGLAEMKRLIVALGGKPQTVSGLSCLGDLLLTATGDLSRNRQVGVALGRGEKLTDILARLGQVAEGVQTTHKVLELARRNNIEMPIAAEVGKVISGEHSVKKAIEVLLSRASTDETL